MDIVRYKLNSPWVGKLICPNCNAAVPAWKSSGMSDCCPHFYCNQCSNVIKRDHDKDLVYKNEISEKLLNKIAETLPECGCGGHFKPGTNPKCPKCNHEFKHQNDPVKRLTDPHVILIDGAVFYRDNLENYQVCIGSIFKYFVRKIKSTLTLIRPPAVKGKKVPDTQKQIFRSLTSD